MVWSIARSFRLDDATAKDVSQTVWLRLVENMHRIDDPERLPVGWPRPAGGGGEGMRERVVPTDFQYDIPDESPSLESMLVEDEEAREVVTALHSARTASSSSGC